MKKRIKELIEPFLRYQSLLKELVIRDIKVRYRKSVLGLLWTVLNPLLMMAVITIVFSTLFRQNIPNYPIYYLTGSLIFNFNSESTTNAMHSVIVNSSLIKKVYIPKYLFPLSKVVSGLVNFGFSLIAMIIVMIVTGTPFHPTILLIPIPIVLVFIFSLGLGLILSSITVFFRDIAHFYGVFIMAWTYLTPIFYPETILPAFASKLLYFNPLYYYISMFRGMVLYGVLPSYKMFLVGAFVAIVSLTIGLYIFYKKQDRFILYV